jgi:hypothetical protein
MLLVTCEIVGREALVWPSDVIAISNSDHGILVRYRCVCGNEAEMLTGTGSIGTLEIHHGSAA